MNSKLREPLNVLYNIGRHEESGGLTDKELALAEAEKAIRQAVGEEMLELVGINEPPSEYDKVAKAIRNKYRTELRQKIKEWQGGEV